MMAKSRMGLLNYILLVEGRIGNKLLMIFIQSICPVVFLKISSTLSVDRIIIPICGDVTSQLSLAQVFAQILQPTAFINLIICND